MAQEKKKINDKKAFDLLKAKEKDFFLYYLELGRNATKAYMKVFPNCKYESAAVEASKFLKKPNVKAALKEHYDALWEKRNDVIGKMFENLLEIGNSDIADVVDYKNGSMIIKEFEKVNTSLIKSISQTTTDTKEGVRTVEKVEMHDKLSAIKEIDKILGLATDKVEHSGSIEIIPAKRPERKRLKKDEE